MTELGENIIKLLHEGKTYNEITTLLNCAKSTVSFHAKNNGFDRLAKIKEKYLDIDWNIVNQYYKKHTARETSDKYKVSIWAIKKNCFKSPRKKLTPEEKVLNNVIAVKDRRAKIKLMSIEYKGSSCERCGYSKCIRALHFHHLNPEEKDFSISAKGYTRSWDKVKKELDKCILVCANCHAEIHEDIDNNQK